MLSTYLTSDFEESKTSPHICQHPVECDFTRTTSCSCLSEKQYEPFIFWLREKLILLKIEIRVVNMY